MENLRVPISSVTAEGYRVNAVVPSEALRPAGSKPMAAGELHVRGVLREADGTYVFTGAVQGAILGRCGRCLEEASQAFSAEVVWVFAQGAEAPLAEEDFELDAEDGQLDDSADVTLFPGSEIDLGARAWEELVLSAPSKLVCSPDCRGLCPKCGANLNASPCECSTDELDKPLGNKGLSGLRDLFPKLPEKSSEE